MGIATTHRTVYLTDESLKILDALKSEHGITHTVAINALISVGGQGSNPTRLLRAIERLNEEQEAIRIANLEKKRQKRSKTDRDRFNEENKS